MTESVDPAPKLLALAGEALSRTQAGSMTWTESDDPDLFVYSGARTSLTVDFYPMEDRYVFRLLNDRGRVVEEVSRRGGFQPNDPWGDEGREFELLKDLHGAARRSALQIDATIQRAFEDLSALDEPPF